MKIGLYFGSFNPIHLGHLAVAQYMIDYTEIERVLFVVSPQNPLKSNDELWDEDLRLELVRLSIFDNEDFGASDIEFDMPKPSYTIDTLDAITTEDQINEFSIIMGSDSLDDLEKWKDHEKILDNYKIHSYVRPGNEKPAFMDHPNVTLHNGIPLIISSTKIRQKIKKGVSVKYLVRDEVYEMLKHGE